MVTEKKTVAILISAATSPLNLFGAAEVFEEANRYVPSGPLYEVEILSSIDTPQSMPYAACLHTEHTFRDREQPVDTLLVAGGLSSSDLDLSGELFAWLKVHCGKARRFGSLCSGSIILAEAGVLDGRQIAAHWSWSEQMTRAYPKVRVRADRIYMQDGNCYTSAGEASAIDLALALVTEDLGEAVSAAIAERMILFLRRSESSPQVSETLIAQRSSNQVINNLLIWMADHVTGDLSVPSLARRVAMSPRNFARHFLQQTGKTPGRHTSDLRMEAAQKLLASGGWTLEEVAQRSGLKSSEGLRRHFHRRLHTSPGQYKRSVSADCSTIAAAGHPA